MCVVPGKRVAMEGMVSGFGEKSVQPAGVDLSIGDIFAFEGPGSIGEEKRLPRVRLILPVRGWYMLEPGAYKVRFREVVSVPLGYAGFCYPRSSLLRSGVAVHCAVWDPGYTGRGEALLVVYNRFGFRVRAGERIAQIVFHKMCEEPEEGYEGSFQGENL